MKFVSLACNPHPDINITFSTTHIDRYPLKVSEVFLAVKLKSCEFTVIKILNASIKIDSQLKDFRYGYYFIDCISEDMSQDCEMYDIYGSYSGEIDFLSIGIGKQKFCDLIDDYTCAILIDLNKITSINCVSNWNYLKFCTKDYRSMIRLNIYDTDEYEKCCINKIKLLNSDAKVDLKICRNKSKKTYLCKCDDCDLLNSEIPQNLSIFEELKSKNICSISAPMDSSPKICLNVLYLCNNVRSLNKLKIGFSNLSFLQQFIEMIDKFRSINNIILKCELMQDPFDTELNEIQEFVDRNFSRTISIGISIFGDITEKYIWSS